MTTVLNPKAKGTKAPWAKPIPKAPKFIEQAPMPVEGMTYPNPDMMTRQEKLHWFDTFPLICELRHRIPFLKRHDVVVNIYKLVREDYPVNLTAKTLGEAFPWHGTPQGGEYWGMLNDEYFGGNDD